MHSNEAKYLEVFKKQFQIITIVCCLELTILDRQWKQLKSHEKDRLDRQLMGQSPASFMYLRDSQKYKKRKVKINEYPLLDGKTGILNKDIEEEIGIMIVVAETNEIIPGVGIVPTVGTDEEGINHLLGRDLITCNVL